MPVKVAIIYYSATGNVHALAEAVAEGAAVAGADVRLRRAAELAPDRAIDENPRWRRHADATARSPGRGRGPGVGRRVRLRDAHAVRHPGRAAQAVHRPGRGTVAGRRAGRQAGDGLHLGLQPARRQRGHDPVAGQRLLPLGRADRPARVHPPGRLRRRGNPYGTSATGPQDGDGLDPAPLEAARYQGRRLVQVTARLLAGDGAPALAGATSRTV